MKKVLFLGCAISLVVASNTFAEVQELNVVGDESYVTWTGRKVTGEHTGTVKLSDGSVKVEDGTIVGGSFTVDMSTINNKDIESDEWRKKLEDHLKSDDFFNISQFPKSTFSIKEVTKGKDDQQVLEGDLTIKGISLPVKVPVTVEKQGDKYVGTGKIVLDRSKWDIKYNSGKFFDPQVLGDKLIYDNIDIEVKVVAAEA